MEYINTTTYPTFKRFCKTLELKDDPSLLDEYKRIHAPNAVWKEVTEGMKEVGIIDMEIYLHGNLLFMIMDTTVDFDPDKGMKELSSKLRQAEWETFVSRFQKTSPNATAAEKWFEIERIFKLDQK